MPHITRTPFTVDVRDVMHRPGEMRERELDFPVPEQFGEGAAVVAQGSDLHIDLRLEGLHDGILVTADVETVATGECGRCLDPVRLPVRVDIQELFGYSEQEAVDYTVRDDHVDLEPVVRDAVVLALPFQPVCRPDCPGLDPITGENLTVRPEEETPAVIDPRWAALEAFTNDSSGAPGTEEEKR